MYSEKAGVRIGFQIINPNDQKSVKILVTNETDRDFVADYNTPIAQMIVEPHCGGLVAWFADNKPDTSIPGIADKVELPEYQGIPALCGRDPFKDLDQGPKKEPFDKSIFTTQKMKKQQGSYEHLEKEAY